VEKGGGEIEVLNNEKSQGKGVKKGRGAKQFFKDEIKK